MIRFPSQQYLFEESLGKQNAAGAGIMTARASKNWRSAMHQERELQRHFHETQTFPAGNDECFIPGVVMPTCESSLLRRRSSLSMSFALNSKRSTGSSQMMQDQKSHGNTQDLISGPRLVVKNSSSLIALIPLPSYSPWPRRNARCERRPIDGQLQKDYPSSRVEKLSRKAKSDQQESGAAHGGAQARSAHTEGALKGFFAGCSIAPRSLQTLVPTRPVGYAFVDLSTADEAQKAIAELSGKGLEASHDRYHHAASPSLLMPLERMSRGGKSDDPWAPVA
ncbi:MAG: hypothetical protein LQ345_004108 [Seirophora villosa]|nr:MAG: hypothetical protein LQ345_004108 [Seirophora villosa]